MLDRSLAAAKEFEGVDLGDERLNKRCLSVVADLARRPGDSLTKACGGRSKAKAAYRFFSNEHVSLEKLLAPAVAKAVERLNQEEAVIAVHDTTTLDFTPHRATEGLGWIGRSDHYHGMIVHTALALSPKGEVVGALHQDVWVRRERMPKDEETSERRNRPRESQRWARGVARTSELGIKRPVIHVFDREGDIYEALVELDKTGHSFVIRARHDRKLKGPEMRLFDSVRSSPDLGSWQIEVPARGKRQARTAHLVVRSAMAEICPPAGMNGSLWVGIVQVTEPNPPEGDKPLEWLLLTREPQVTFEECRRVTEIYAKRWTIEDFHMALKTGCRIEERQLQSRSALEAFLGVANVIAVMLLRLRQFARSESALASAVLIPEQLQILRHHYPEIGPAPTARVALRAVAQLGGFLGRKGDGDPGWRTLWSGYSDLTMMVYGLSILKQSAPTNTCG